MEANDSLDAQFTLHYNEDRADCCGVPLTRLDPNGRLLGTPLTQGQAIAGVIPVRTTPPWAVDQVPKANQEDIGFTAHIAYDFGDVTLLAITGIDQYHLHDLTDNDTGDADVCSTLRPSRTQPGGLEPAVEPDGSCTGGLLQGGSVLRHTFSQEFRLASDGHHDFNYLAGAYFSNEDLVRNFGRGFQDNSKAVANWRGETRYNNYALFGQTTWTFLPRTTLLTGLRLNREESSYTYDDYLRVIHFPSFGNPTRTSTTS